MSLNKQLVRGEKILFWDSIIGGAFQKRVDVLLLGGEIPSLKSHKYDQQPNHHGVF